MRGRLLTRRGAIAAALVGVVSAISVRLLPSDEAETQTLSFAPDPQWRSLAPKTYADHMAYHNALAGFELSGDVATARQYLLLFLQAPERVDQAPTLVSVIQDTNRTPYIPELIAALAPGSFPERVREASAGALLSFYNHSGAGAFSASDINAIVAAESSGAESSFRIQMVLTQLAAALTGN